MEKELRKSRTVTVFIMWTKYVHETKASTPFRLPAASPPDPLAHARGYEKRKRRAPNLEFSRPAAPMSFIPIAAYREPKRSPTIRDCLAKASHG